MKIKLLFYIPFFVFILLIKSETYALAEAKSIVKDTYIEAQKIDETLRESHLKIASWLFVGANIMFLLFIFLSFISIFIQNPVLKIILKILPFNLIAFDLIGLVILLLNWDFKSTEQTQLFKNVMMAAFFLIYLIAGIRFLTF